ncbi:uncharacterized protein [Parasteatoda tepidariorum]|uniref:uncharacterized protein n=1 Tax=Parasteatoda tepidariorum TaxID=114398 RepID=UPI0039BD54B6
MDLLIDDLVGGRVSLEDIPIFQDGNSSLTKGDFKQDYLETMPQPNKLKLMTNSNRNKREREIISHIKNAPRSDVDCSMCESHKTENSVLKTQVRDLAAVLKSHEEALERLQMKYKKLKTKYKQKKEQKTESDEAESLIKIGGSLRINKHKLAMCRTNDYSKYTCNILDVVFGRECLSKSVIKGCSKDALNPGYLADIIGHVSFKFGVSLSVVLATLRNKLNSSSKAVIKNK